MSKRSFYPQQFGARKKPKLDVTVSDHNFPLSQNSGPSKASTQDNWGDDNDDEILLLASQACEDAYIGHDVTSVPDYTICMQPGSTSTQLFNEPSTSNSSFSFKKPINTIATQVSTNYKDKCNRISSPLHGITAKPDKYNEMNLTDDLILNDQIFKGQDFDQMYKQMLQLKEENVKLKSENGKLMEKCVTKEGEASILRTQLKTCQVSIDHARLDKIRAQEKVQNEWTDKLNAATVQLQNLKTQLDFKNLEIISTKEKCKILESSKVKLTQVSVNPANETTRFNSSFSVTKGKPATATSAAQTDRAGRVVLTKMYRRVTSDLNRIIPLILEPTEEQYSILDDEPSPPTDSRRARSADPPQGERVARVREDVTYLAAFSDGPTVDVEERIARISSATLVSLAACVARLRSAAAPAAAARRDDDDRYLEGTAGGGGGGGSGGVEDLVSGRSLYKDERCIEARRLTATLTCVLESTPDLHCREVTGLLAAAEELCQLVERNSCASLYSGLLLSIAYLLQTIQKQSDDPTIHAKLLDIAKTIVMSRPMNSVTSELLQLTARLATLPTFLESVCCGNTGGNMKLDYDQGVLLYKKETCYLQVVARQMECVLKSAEREPWPAARAARALLALHRAGGGARSCDCETVIFQVMVYALQICAVMLTDTLLHKDSGGARALGAVCAAAVPALHRHCTGAGAGAGTGAGGHLRVFVEWCGAAGAAVSTCDVYATMLSELECWLQSTEDAAPAPAAARAWRLGLRRLRQHDD